MSKTICISDIHGCINEFIKLLELSKYNPESDKLVLCGDYIDRGRNSKQVVEKVRELQKNKNVIVLCGNHEKMLLDWYRGFTDTYIYNYNGGANTLISFENNVEDTVKWIKALPLSYVDEDFIYTHAGLNPAYPLSEQTEDDLLWIREPWFDGKYEGKPVIFGHTLVCNIWGKNTPWITTHKIGIDTGGVFGRKFTALIINEDKSMEYVQVDGVNLHD